MNPPNPTILISAAEPSADLHAARLIEAVHRIQPDVQFAGVAGPAMRDAGCRGMFDMTEHAAMLLGALGAVRPALKMLKSLDQAMRQPGVAAIVLVDSPTLNLRVATKARKRGIPVLYFIAPQLWAWGRRRMGRVRRDVDRLAVILPFEEAFFRRHDVNTTFVGHPLFESLASKPANDRRVQQIRGQGQPVIALLPGSRRHVAYEVLPGQLEVAAAIHAAYPDAHFGVSVANDSVRPVIDSLCSASHVPVSRYADANTDLLTAADLTLVASGTATLEVAYRGSPMIVMYNANKWVYHLIGRWLIKTPYLCLVNILADRQLVPEFMPYYTDTRPIADRALDLLADEDARKKMTDALKQLVQPLVQQEASGNTAELLLDMIREKTRA